MKRTWLLTMEPLSLKLGGNPALQQSFQQSLGLTDDFDLQEYMSPQDSDFIHVPMRALSATTVQGGIIDFGHANGAALKNAVPLFNGLTIFKDHKQSVDMAVGKTSGAFWDDQTPGVPAGVNFMLDVDSKIDPKLARNLTTGTVDSGSVTIRFSFDKSHPKMKDDEFMWRLGETVDGQTVRALVTNIERCLEYSTVWQGADTFAKVIGEDGKIVTPGVASNSLNLNQPQEKTPMNLQALAALLGLDLGENVTLEALEAAAKEKGLTLAALSKAVADLTAANAQVADLTQQLTVSSTQVTTLSSEVATLKPQAALGTTFLQNVRNEALRLYNLAEGDKASDAMRQLIKDASLEVAESFVTSYSDRANAVAPLACTKCGCSELSRQTAKQPIDMPGLNAASGNKLRLERMNAAIASVHGK